MRLNHIARRLAMASLCVLIARSAPAELTGRQLKSPALAAELQAAMEEKKLEAIALPDPGTPGGFIAVLLIPKVQLLVVAARHPSVDYVTYQIQQKKYRDVYTLLQQPDVTAERVFFQDMGADGLHATEGSVDVMYVHGKQTVLGGDDRKGGGPKTAKALQDADERYARMLRHAIAAARAETGGTLPDE
jgi:hypothetical protein